MVHKCNDCFSMRGNLFSIIYKDVTEREGEISLWKVQSIDYGTLQYRHHKWNLSLIKR